MTETTTERSEKPKPQSGELLQFTNPDVMHEVIADQLKEVKNYTGDFNEFFNYEKDAKIKPNPLGRNFLRNRSVTLRIRYIVLEDKTLLSIKELFGVDGLMCSFKK